MSALPAIPTSPIFGASEPERVAVTASSAAFNMTLASGAHYEIVSSTLAWVKIAANPTAVADASGNMLLAPNVPTRIAAQGALNKVAIVRDAADGEATLYRVAGVM